MATPDSFFHSLTGDRPEVVVVDVGANPIDGPRPYERLLLGGNCRLFGFEPDEAAITALERIKGPGETYLRLAVADGSRHLLHVCAASGMSSLLRPNRDGLASFGRFAEFGTVLRTEQLDTVRLDDVVEVDRMDFLKIDAQGSELMILQNAARLLAGCVAVQLEVLVAPMYESQPTIADLDGLLVRRGFRLLRLSNLQHRLLGPVTNPTSPHAAGSQLGWMDAIYIRDPFGLESFEDDALTRGARLAHECFRAPDLAIRLLAERDRRVGSSLARSYAAGHAGLRLELPRALPTD